MTSTHSLGWKKVFGVRPKPSSVTIGSEPHKQHIMALLERQGIGFAKRLNVDRTAAMVRTNSSERRK